MKGPFSAFASQTLRITTTPAGQSTLPGWLLAPLAIMAGEDSAPASKPGWADQSLVRKAIALYRAASSYRGSDAAVNWQFSPDGRQAIQVLPPPADSQQRQAFVDISRLLESVTLNHPRLTPILEAAYQQGYPFLAASIAEGFQALTKRFGLPMDPQQAMAIAEQVTSALEYAHYRGVIHGSFDLGDILVNERGQVHLLGVGVEQLRQGLGANGITVSSPLMPAEVESGEQPADMRADVYAMGALLYVLLTGHVPAAGQEIHLSQSIPTVPVAVDGVLTKALAIKPEERYANLMEMGRELRVAIRAPRAVTKPSLAPARSKGATPARTRSVSALASATQDAAPAPPRAPGTTPDGFPEPLPMPSIDFTSLNQVLEMPQVSALVAIEIPAAPPIPKIDWAEMLRPVDVSAFSREMISLPYAAAQTLAPDPLVAAAMAVKATEQMQQSRQRQPRQQAASQAAAAAKAPEQARQGQQPPQETAASPDPAAKPPPPSKAQPPAKPRRVRRK